MFPVPFCQQDGIIDRKREKTVLSHQVGIAWEGRRKMAEFEDNGSVIRYAGLECLVVRGTGSEVMKQYGSGSIRSLKKSITGSPIWFFWWD